MNNYFSNEIEQIAARVTALSEARRPVVIGIDGMAKSGKSTLAALLAEKLDAAVISMAHFPLPPGMRTPKRLRTPGGNVYHERFVREVLPYVRSGNLFGYGVYDAKARAYTEQRAVWPKPVIIVEGTYALHPAFGDLYDLRMFCKVSPHEQLQRLQGDENLELYKAMWLPMEQQYFAGCAVESRCDMVVTSGAAQPAPPLEIERKFLIRMPDLVLLQAKAERVIDIEQTYLTGGAPGVSMRVRKSTWGGKTVYHRNEKRPITNMVRVEEEAEIDEKHYKILLGFADPKLRTICKTRYCVPMGGLTVEIDVFPFWQNQAFCEVELPDEGMAVELPEWLEVIREVTEDKRYTNLALAKEVPAE